MHAIVFALGVVVGAHEASPAPVFVGFCAEGPSEPNAHAKPRITVLGMWDEQRGLADLSDSNGVMATRKTVDLAPWFVLEAGGARAQDRKKVRHRMVRVLNEADDGASDEGEPLRHVMGDCRRVGEIYATAPLDPLPPTTPEEPASKAASVAIARAFEKSTQERMAKAAGAAATRLQLRAPRARALANGVTEITLPFVIRTGDEAREGLLYNLVDRTGAVLAAVGGTRVMEVDGEPNALQVTLGEEVVTAKRKD